MNKKSRHVAVLLLAATMAGTALVGIATAQDNGKRAAKPDKKSSPEQKSIEQRKQDFLKLKFGMFIHFNMATFHDVQWVKGYPDPSTFDPGGKVDTDAWADAAKSAGMTYGVLTAKQVVKLLETVNSRNSNFLLNVGPDRQGRFEGASINVLAEIGKLRDRKAPPDSLDRR